MNLGMSLAHLPGGGVRLCFGGRPVDVLRDNPVHAEVVKALKDRVSADELLRIIESQKQPVTENIQLTADIRLLTTASSSILFGGKPVNRALSERFVRLLDDGFDSEPLAALLANLMANPSEALREELFPAIERGGLTITSNGTFLAYKPVRGDYSDNDSGATRYDVGASAEASGAGLRVLSFGCLPAYAHANTHVMLCEVNPRDVVHLSVSGDRVCLRTRSLVVLGELCDETAAGTQKPLFPAGMDPTEHYPFLIEADHGAGYEPHSHFRTLSEAAKEYEEVIELIGSLPSGLGPDMRLSRRVPQTVILEERGIRAVGLTFQVVATDENGQVRRIAEGLPTVMAAVSEAITLTGFKSVQVKDSRGTLVKTLS